MGSSAEIYRKYRSEATEAELVQEYMKIAAPLGYDTCDNGGVYEKIPRCYFSL